ncbi:MAG: galactose mutarotase [Clostridia bacterium]|nr:galactose mutarotase [Clostridia bacterium]
MEIRKFGIAPGGEEVRSYILSNENGITVEILSYGAAIRRLLVPDKDGKADDIICGYDDMEGYLKGGGYQGATVGRYCNRIANGKFTLNGKEYVLALNDGSNHLHGGIHGFNEKVWDCVASESDGDIVLVCKTTSPDGEEGYPGNMDITVTFTLSGKDLSIHYEAVSDKDTICSLTNHTYFNLSGYGSGDIARSHSIRINADEYTETDESLTPTGKILPVEGTIYDLRKLTPIKENYDDNFVLGGEGVMKEAAYVEDSDSGRHMTVSTDMPGMQFYSANMMDGDHPFKGGVKQVPHCAFCLETQYYPDSPNHENFSDCTLKAGEKYDFTTMISF